MIATVRFCANAPNDQNELSAKQHPVSQPEPSNHTYSHQDANQLSPEQMEDEIIQGETGFVPLMK